MSERRPHWDDDLIEAVRALTRTCPYEDYNCEVDDAQTYAVIAAVEDWVLSAPIFDLYLSRKHAPDKAAIARVRHLATTGILAAPDLTEFDKGYNTALLHLQKALEGDNDD